MQLKLTSDKPVMEGTGHRLDGTVGHGQVAAGIAEERLVHGADATHMGDSRDGGKQNGDGAINAVWT